MSSSDSETLFSTVGRSLPIPELIRLIRHSFRGCEFDEIENILMDREKNLKIEMEDLARAHDSLKEEVQLLERTQGLEELEKLKLEEKLQRNQRKCEELKETITRLMEEQRVCIDSEKRAKERYEKISEENIKISKQKNKSIFELNEKINELKNKNLESERLLAVYDQKVKCFDARLVKMAEEIECFRSEKLTADQTVEELRQRLSEADQVNDELKRQNVELTQTVGDLRLKNVEADQVNEELKRQNIELTQTVDDLRLEKVKADQVNEELKRQNIELTETVDDLRLKKVEADQVNEELKRQNIELTQTADDLRLKKVESDDAAKTNKSRLENLAPRIKKVEEALAHMLSVRVEHLADIVDRMEGRAAKDERGNVDFPDSKGANDNLKNDSTQDGGDGDAGNMGIGARSTCNSTGSGSIGLSKKGGRKLVQSCRIKEDGADTVQTSPGSQSGYNSPPAESTGTDQGNGREGLRRSGAESKALQNSGGRKLVQSCRIKEDGANTIQTSLGSQSGYNSPPAESSGADQDNGREGLRRSGAESKALENSGPHAGFMCPDGEAPIRGELVGAGCPSKTTRSTSAGGNIIVICDSDDETACTPDRGANLAENEMTVDKFVQTPSSSQTSKRKRTDFTKDSLINLTTKRKRSISRSDKDNTPMNEKKNQILKLTNDGIGSLENNCLVKPTRSPISHSVSRSREKKSGAVCDPQTPLQKFNALNNGDTTDSEDESCSDSCMDELIESLEREKLSRKWTFEADMLQAFQEDVELCMNAVCALYRQQIALGKSAHGSSKHGAFSHIDAISGRALAEYLIDGDSELRLKKSVSDVKEQRPDVISQCRKLATIYHAKLFEIYCNGEDPFFGRT
ncbi:hypothetical protein Salat_1836200 [Sesamum alatum]|uniref:Uncharacterized protein n=1 Tax=Sesamum alatum TaxID=300844 RepID=A0AAE2CHQ7_9LAMI|nr:hypothetical protein Salat_1836200 [Sesamum alatum]